MTILQAAASRPGRRFSDSESGRPWRSFHARRIRLRSRFARRTTCSVARRANSERNRRRAHPTLQGARTFLNRQPGRSVSTQVPQRPRAGPAIKTVIVETSPHSAGIMHSRRGVPSCSVAVSREGGPMPSPDEIRDVQRATWAGLSASWEKWDEVIMDQLGPVGAAMIERLDIAEDQQHLDIASGTGEPGLTIARLSPKGRVVLTDLAAEMLDVAARRARAQGVANVETQVCSADDLPFDDATFDSVSVRFGYMFFPDVTEATAEFARVLKPGGRLCSSVWVKPEKNPWTTIAMQAIATEAAVASPDPDGPNMFRCAAPGYVSALYEGAGLRDVAEWDVDVELVTRSPAQYWDMISDHVSLAVAALQRVDAPARERIRARAIAKVSAFEKDGTVRVPGVARCIVGTKPHASTQQLAR